MSVAAAHNWLFPKHQRFISREEAERMYLPQDAPAPPPPSFPWARALLAAGGLAAIGGAAWYFFYLRPKRSSASSSSPSSGHHGKAKYRDGSFASVQSRAKRDQATAEAASAAPARTGPIRSVKPPVLSTLAPPDRVDGAARGEWVRSTAFPEDRGFGCFHCTSCGHLWRSLNAWTKEVRQCPKCMDKYYPPYAMWKAEG